MNAIQRVSHWKVSHPLLAGVVYAFVWMALGALALSVMLYSSSASEDDMISYTYIVHAIALFIGGWISGRRSGKKGWYYGGITGLCYSMLVLLIGFLAMDAGLSGTKLLLVLIAFCIGALGGIIGVNMSRTGK
ncbi:TIGR04086 family membrane protein [Paenibacillus profundus]|uniref:TIGR04086 family membrane protein n=1 Tax=Paenibacillus profundus TaxID=1173085 RepID=A0ABS8YKL0_9BACL|nr:MULTISPECIES: TIGR04086 family membrane protein [Paenibacillus]MCE5171719.1 TIGR04086 family membrane protein [Paenibacillus profundus]